MTFRLKSLAFVGGARRLGRRRGGGRSQDRAHPRPHRPAAGLRQADRDRLHDGARIRHQGHDGGRRAQDRRHHQGRPVQARPRQDRARRGLRGRRRRHRRRHDLVGRGDRHAAGRRGAQEDPDRRAGGRRRDHRRRSGTATSSAPAAIPRRTRSRTRSRSASPACISRRSAQDYAFGRDGVAAFKEALAKTGATLVAEEYAPAEHDRLHRAGAAPVRRAEGQAGQEDHLDHLGRRRRSARQARRPRSRPLRHRAFDRRQHPAGARRLQALPRPRGRGLLLLRHPQEPGERLARRRAQEALQRAAGLLHRGRLRRGDGAS